MHFLHIKRLFNSILSVFTWVLSELYVYNYGKRKVFCLNLCGQCVYCVVCVDIFCVDERFIRAHVLYSWGEGGGGREECLY